MTRLLILVPVAVMVLVACWGDSRPRPAAVESGAAPEGEGKKVALSILVREGGGGPVAGASVTWRVTAGGGTVSPATGSTDRTGRATATWTLGPDSLRNTAEATARVGDYWEVTKFEAAAAPADTIRPSPR
jgi:hypothetical protein